MQETYESPGQSLEMYIHEKAYDSLKQAHSMEGIKIRKRLQNSARNAALHPCTLYKAWRSKGSAHTGTGRVTLTAKGPWTKSSFRLMRKGISRGEMGKHNSRETFNSTVHLRSHRKVRSKVEKAFRHEAVPTHGPLSACYGAWILSHGP